MAASSLCVEVSKASQSAGGKEEPGTTQHIAQARTDSGAKPTYRQRYSALKPFIIISSSYLLYTTTDGAIRMIVLLNAYKLGFTAMEVAVMFSLYEIGRAHV